LVDWCAVVRLESFPCVFCQSKEFDRVTDWLKHSLQAIVVSFEYELEIGGRDNVIWKISLKIILHFSKGIHE
jgi:hypothetical protein